MTSSFMVTVSVIMSVHNGERYIREAIDSIISQSFTDFEFIIIDDGSTDTTRAIVEAYHDDRITLIHQKKEGLTKALNKGISLARGRYIARHDADDVSKPERLAKQVAYLEENRDVGLLGTRFEFIDQSGEVISRSMLQTENDKLQERLPKINQFCHASVMMRREAIDKVGTYREFFQYAQDYDLWLRIAESFAIANLPEMLVQYRVQDQAISTSKILLQSQFACAASKLAEQRRTTGYDDLDRGDPTPLPHFEEFSLNLQNKLVDHYCQNPLHLAAIVSTPTTAADAKAILEHICLQRKAYEAEIRRLHQALKQQSEVVDTKNKSPEGDTLKDAQLKELGDLLKTKDLELTEQRDRIKALMGSLSWKITKPLRAICSTITKK
ncbi:glycosyltransferase [Geomonas terrae]|uniref:Glycosyltransferase n=1 Tax=Geomonas terrae TaxID=2562681 RepID=A0A4S1CAA5_9BACT|nr:glycosyltransferase [Geomonas terrae]TGU70215.1 glycosyltransferase [Geomonas terrae]